ncbi:MAG: RNA polymerase sigma factor [bacterium]
MQKTDHQLVAQVVALNDQQAFGILVKRYQVLIKSLMLRLTSNAALADDLAQMSFIKAHKKLDKYSGKGSFKAWLCSIAHKEFLQAIRKRKATEAVLDKYRAQQPENEAQTNWDSGDVMDLDRALVQLSDVERSLIVLCFSCGLSHNEASEVTHLPLGTVKSHINRAKIKLRAMLKDHTEARK